MICIADAKVEVSKGLNIIKYYMSYMKLKINWDHKRCKHAIERMWLRGISNNDIKNAITRGQKHYQKKTKLMESIYSFYSVVYQEFINKDVDIKKVYPITVKLW